MDKQLTFADLESSSRRRTTRREAFPRETGGAAPRAEPLALIEPSCHDGRRGRPPVGRGRMPRKCFPQTLHGLSDEGAGDARRGSRAFSDFLGVSLDGRDQAPGATTLPRSRHVAGDDGPGRAVPGEADRALGARGAATRGGPAAGATFIDAPSSTKNAAGERDPRGPFGGVPPSRKNPMARPQGPARLFFSASLVGA